jgi:hypothetical protein
MGIGVEDKTEQNRRNLESGSEVEGARTPAIDRLIISSSRLPFLMKSERGLKVGNISPKDFIFGQCSYALDTAMGV